jgi:hypothetical protein
MVLRKLRVVIWIGRKPAATKDRWISLLLRTVDNNGKALLVVAPHSRSPADRSLSIQSITIRMPEKLGGASECLPSFGRNSAALRGQRRIWNRGETMQLRVGYELFGAASSADDAGKRTLRDV